MNYFSRMHRFSKQMYPFFPAQILTFGIFVLNYMILSRYFISHEVSAIELVCGGLTLTVLGFGLRACDEIKDYPTDKINFPNRPLVVGVVSHRDVWISIWASVIILLALNIPFWGRPVFGMLLFNLFYGFLMFKWFFAERHIRPSLPLALLSHHPIVFLNYLYIATFFGNIFDLPLKAIAFLIGFSLMLTAWEISRKMRGTSQEDTYTTYTKIWGIPGAVTVLATIMTLSVVLTHWGLSDLPMASPMRVAWLLPTFVWLWILIQCGRFLSSRQVAPELRKSVELYGSALMVAGIAGLLL
ncbi:MAG: UbiA family prenyltransferase [Oligoflexia bacterium]|nr:UbiA family prenyltransferase [Oligoflexia bacterium]